MIGKKRGPYRIEAPLGADGMGKVHRAIPARLGQVVLAASFLRSLDELYLATGFSSR